MRRWIGWVVLGLVVVLAGIQLVPVDRSNPPVIADAGAPPEVDAVLRRSCYDCHSRETSWPWYSRIAPVSWLVAHDVSHGREHLDFSVWGTLDAKEVAEQREEIEEVITEGEMPLWYYLPLHPEADLSASDRALILDWARGRRAYAEGVRPASAREDEGEDARED